MARAYHGQSTAGLECRELGQEWKQSPGKSSLEAKLRSLSTETRSSALICVGGEEIIIYSGMWGNKNKHGPLWES